jgi:myo-inositol-1(or 4)-monophosphatase
VASEAGARVEGLYGRAASGDLLVAAPVALFPPLHDLLADLRADSD